MHSRVESRGLAVLVPYLRMARADHWFKNVFMLLGVALAFFWRPDLLHAGSLLRLLSALGATCIVASSNYVLNEFLDAATDREHPLKRERPAARGEIEGWAALLLWGALGMGGILWGFEINGPFGASIFLLWIMGCAYNIPPVRTKEIAYLDVLSESINNPIRLLLGWFALVPDRLPPLSLALAYWMAGAFFMAMKRLAEYRTIDDPARAARYRRSFRRYDENNLLASLVFYLTAGATFAGIFIVRYKPELVLATPLMAGFFAHYMLVGLAPDSPVQHPERLHRERRLFAFGLLTTLVCAALLFLEMPALRELFHVQPSSIEPLWRIGS